MSERLDTSVLDLSVLRESIGDRPRDLAEMLDLFLLTIQAELDALHAASAQSASDDAEMAAHRMKGAARAVGARRLAELCQLLESAAHASDWDALRGDLLCVHTAVEDVVRAVRTT